MNYIFIEGLPKNIQQDLAFRGFVEIVDKQVDALHTAADELTDEDKSYKLHMLACAINNITINHRDAIARGKIPEFSIPISTDLVIPFLSVFRPDLSIGDLPTNSIFEIESPIIGTIVELQTFDDTFTCEFTNISKEPSQQTN